MFGKLFGRSKVKRDQLGFAVSAVTVPGSETTVKPGVETTVTTTRTDFGPGFGGMSFGAGAGLDLQAMLATVQEVQAQAGGDSEAMAKLLQERFGGDAMVTVDESSTKDWSVVPGQDPISLLAQLTELHEKGVVTDEQFEAQKRRLLG